MLGMDKQGGARIIQQDLEQGLPPLPRVSVIVTDNLLEHITNLIPLLNDCHRALLPHGRMHIRVPNAERGATVAWADPTHKRAFVSETFDYFDVSNPRWQEYGQTYGILPWRIVYAREVERFIDVMMRPADG